ncbi:MAG: DUF192 domain-containing protein [Phycisphaeraceae bacterium]|nr:DUF192 domain-containing protein [Phycisphaeraceae bacterium]
MGAQRRVMIGALVLACLGLIGVIAISAATGDSQPGGSAGSRDTGEITEAGLPIEELSIAGETFRLEVAATNEHRMKGLGDREEIAEKGGMLFTFRHPQVRYFVMRDCYADIDIIFLDAVGRITATHAMTIEEPRGDDETDNQYASRLKRYSSRHPCQFAIELKGGTIERLSTDPETARKFAPGQKIRLDYKRLRRNAEPD